jgi:hypothetical protein
LVLLEPLHDLEGEIFDDSFPVTHLVWCGETREGDVERDVVDCGVGNNAGEILVVLIEVVCCENSGHVK